MELILKNDGKLLVNTNKLQFQSQRDEILYKSRSWKNLGLTVRKMADVRIGRIVSGIIALKATNHTLKTLKSFLIHGINERM